ncbi:fibropellin-1-like [Chironomus tepperi]|uniref:fibropellin-1-like n=1 Tax=Chironomus tepperi TaxID=113505 RepID=UPI00391F1C5E
MIRLLLLTLLIIFLISIIDTYVNQCTTDSDCPYDKSCNAQICSDPCVGSCGANATCIPMNHGAYCSCEPGFSGDPFDICYEDYDGDPYDEFLCGPYSKFVNATSVDDSYCLCLPTFRGRPPNCTFIDCYTDDDCFWNENCDFNECVDPCDPNPCGLHSKCRSGGHQRARCSCDTGYFPEANYGCRVEIPEDKLVSVEELAAKLTGLCGSVCGINAYCSGNGSCVCSDGYSGDPTVKCDLNQFEISEQECTPNPCGPYSTCTYFNNNRNCSCLPGYISSPPNCSRCKSDTDCPKTYVCITGECTENPCLPFCGYQASCEVYEGKIECYCEEINRYNPFMECPRLVDTDNICANANRPECGVNLKQIFKHSMYPELDYDFDEKYRSGDE